MLYQDRSFEYPKTYILVRSAGIMFGFAMMLLGFSMLLFGDFFTEGWTGILVICASVILLGGGVFEKQNANTILVNDQEIIALKGGKKVVIPWSSIEHIYYSASRGPGAPGPLYSLYIFSKTNDFIIIRQQIRGFSDLMGFLKEYLPKREAEYMPFLQLVGIFLRIYLLGKNKANLPSKK